MHISSPPVPLAAGGVIALFHGLSMIAKGLYQNAQ